MMPFLLRFYLPAVEGSVDTAFVREPGPAPVRHVVDFFARRRAARKAGVRCGTCCSSSTSSPRAAPGSSSGRPRRTGRTHEGPERPRVAAELTVPQQPQLPARQTVVTLHAMSLPTRRSAVPCSARRSAVQALPAPSTLPGDRTSRRAFSAMSARPGLRFPTARSSWHCGYALAISARFSSFRSMSHGAVILNEIRLDMRPQSSAAGASGERTTSSSSAPGSSIGQFLL